MDTPTSQAQTNPPVLKLEDCLSQLAAGNFAYSQLPSFSDLPRDRLRMVERIWLDLDHDIRRKLIGSAVDLSDESVDYQFNRLFRIGLLDSEPDVRQLAISGLWEDDSRSLLNDLISVSLDDPSDDVRAAAIRHLGDAVPVLIEREDDDELVERISDLVLAIASDEDEPALVRRRAIEALGGLEQSDESRELIEDAYGHGDQELEAGALVAMGRSLESRWLEIVRIAAASEDAEIRYEASRALGSLGTTDDVPLLAERTIDEDSDVRHAAIAALGEIGGPGSVRVLRALAEHVGDADKELIDAALDTALLMNEPFRMPS